MNPEWLLSVEGEIVDFPVNTWMHSNPRELEHRIESLIRAYPLSVVARDEYLPDYSGRRVLIRIYRNR